MAALAALVLFSCTKKEVVELTVSTLAVNYEVAGGEQSVTITCNDHWTASVTVDWITLSAKSGDGNATLKITVPENKSIESREADVTVSAGEIKRVVKVGQQGKEPVLTVTPEAVSAEVAGGTFDVTVSSNVEWTVSIPEAAASWLSADKASAEGNAVVKLTVAANEGFEAREASVTVAGGKLTQVVKVAQVGLEPVLIVAPVALQAEDTETPFDVTITSNLAWTVTIPEDAAWITADKVSGEGNAVVKVTVAANETINPRDAKLTVAGGEFSIEIPVEQKGQDPKLVLDMTSKEVPCEGDAFQVSVSANVPWSVFIPVEATWLKAEPGSGEGNGTVTLTVEKNIFLTGRSATVQFVAGIDQELVANLAVTQELAPASHASDSLALVAIYNAANGATWKEERRWDLTKPIDQWDGVKLTDGRVTSLAITASGVISSAWTMPKEIGTLSELTVLKFNQCKLTGEIPEEVYSLTKLTDLWFQNDALSGSLSEKIGQLTALKNLYIDRNTDLGGSIPAAIGQLKALNSINISKTGIGGAIPAELTGCTALANFMAYETKLSGQIPDFWDQFKNIGVVQLYNNPGLEGPLPASCGRATTTAKSYSLRFDGCNLTGNIPESYATLPSVCKQFYVKNNKLSGVIPEGVQAHANWEAWKPAENILPQQDGYGLLLAYTAQTDSLALIKIYQVADGANWKESRRWDMSKPMKEWPGVKLNGDGRVIECSITNGTVTTVEWELPAEIANLSELQIFQAVGSKVKGDFPDFLYNLTKLTKLVVNGNNITGSLSAKVANWTELTNLYVNNNKQFGGTLPVELGSLKKLQNLNIAQTAIGGAVPAELSGCEALSAFMAYETAFTSIPDNWDQWPALKIIQLYGCEKLECPLPASIGNMKNVTSLQLKNGNFTGNIPESYGNLPSTCTQLFLNGNKLQGVVPAAVQAHEKWQATTGWKYETNILPQQEGFGLTLE